MSQANHVSNFITIYTLKWVFDYQINVLSRDIDYNVQNERNLSVVC